MAITTRARLDARADLMARLRAALRDRTTMTWGQGQRINWMPMAAEMGIVLVTITAAAKRGHKPKRGVVPVVLAYFGAPLQRYAGLFILHIQTRPEKP